MSEDETRAEIAEKVAEVSKAQTAEIKATVKHEAKWNRLTVAGVAAIVGLLLGVWKLGVLSVDEVVAAHGLVELPAKVDKLTLTVGDLSTRTGTLVTTVHEHGEKLEAIQAAQIRIGDRQKAQTLTYSSLSKLIEQAKHQTVQ